MKEPELIGVRRWGDDGNTTTPILIDPRARPSACRHAGCIGLEVRCGGAYRLIHLTSADALRLSDLLRAMAETNEATGE